MADNKTRARHRSDVRPKTPLTAITDSLSNVPTRKGVAVATGAALTLAGGAFAIGAPDDPAQAQPVKSQKATIVTAKSGDAVTDARLALAANPEVVAPDTPWTDSAALVETADEVAAADSAAAAQTQSATNYNYNHAAAPVAHAAPAPAANPAAQIVGGPLVDIAMRYQGTPYVYGGTSPSGFDCSGFVQYVYGQAGIGLPRTSYAQTAAGQHVSMADAKPGDIVSWGYHVGIYAGNGMMIHSPQPGQAVTVAPVWGGAQFVRVN